MLIIHGRFAINPEQRDAFLTFARQLVERERREPGIVRFEILEDVTQPNHFLMLEQWEDDAALERHTQTEAYAQNAAALERFAIGAPAWDEYDA